MRLLRRQGNLDGWNELYLPVLRLVAPHLSPAALVVPDLSADLEPYLRRHVRDAQGDWRSITLPLDAGVEVLLSRDRCGYPVV